MRIVIFTVLAAAQAPAMAFDFRGVEIGQSCRHAAEMELSLGMQFSGDLESAIQGGILIFEDGSIAGQHTKILYGCKTTSSVVSLYSIKTTTHSAARAWELFANAKAAAVSRLGAPNSDSSAPQATEKVREGIAWMHEIAIWTSVEHQSVSLTIEEEDGEWSVATIVSKDRQKSPNKSLERTRAE